MFVGSVSSLEAFKQNKKFAIIHKKCKVIHILIGWQAYRGDQIHRKNSPT